ncbi:MAG: hypothetical protein WCK86_11400 [Planctomycetia bacterium]
MTDALKRHHLEKMGQDAAEGLARACELIIAKAEAPLTANSINAVQRDLSSFITYMSEHDELHAIDGRSSDASVIPGETWAEGLKKSGEQITMNSLENVVFIIRAMQPQLKQPDSQNGN